jgi:hypothetical protein
MIDSAWISVFVPERCRRRQCTRLAGEVERAPRNHGGFSWRIESERLGFVRSS